MTRSTKQPFAFDLDPADITRQRQKARELRASQWWKRRLAKGVCYYCGRAFPFKAFTMDHVAPISRGGHSTKGNVVTACKDCNSRKKQLLPMEWEAYLRGLQS
ncbi:MAG: HNH endonuclease [Desulfobacterales bacterium]|nr:HNH endonuclease [Desulfobacterales bacterium]